MDNKEFQNTLDQLNTELCHYYRVKKSLEALDNSNPFAADVFNVIQAVLRDKVDDYKKTILAIATELAGTSEE